MSVCQRPVSKVLGVMVLVAVLQTASAIKRKTALYAAEEKKLFDYLMRDYNSFIRPVYTQTNTTTVAVGLGLVSILDVNIEGGFIELQVWIRQTWQDSFLQWDPVDFNSLDHISVPSSKLWQPDINLMNSLYEGGVGGERISFAIVQNNGSVQLIKPARIRVACQFDMYHFPSDIQVCDIRFASWTYDINTMVITFYKDDGRIDLAEARAHSSWRIKETKAKRSTSSYACCPEVYPEVTFSLTLQRTSVYFYSWFIRPLILLFFLLPFAFLLPAADKPKILSVLLLVVTLALFMVEQQVPSKTMPMLGHMYMGLLTGTVVATILAILTYHIHCRDGGPPRILKTILVDILGRFLCVRPQPIGTSGSDVGMTTMDGHSSADNASDKADMETQTVLPQQKRGQPHEWRQMSLVLDRLLFVIYLIVCIICVLFLWSYY